MSTFNFCAVEEQKVRKNSKYLNLIEIQQIVVVIRHLMLQKQNRCHVIKSNPVVLFYF